MCGVLSDVEQQNSSARLNRGGRGVIDSAIFLDTRIDWARGFVASQRYK